MSREILYSIKSAFYLWDLRYSHFRRKISWPAACCEFVYHRLRAKRLFDLAMKLLYHTNSMPPQFMYSQVRRRGF